MTASLQPGAIVDAKYRVERVLGEGATSWLLQATDELRRQRVTMKVLKVGTDSDLALAEQVLARAQAMERMRSEHIARVLDAGELPDGSPYIVREHVSGTSLASLLQQRGALPLPNALTFLLQACEAIAEAHAVGLVHGDLKPANLVLTHRGDGSSCIKIVGFEPGPVAGPLSLTPGDELHRTPHHLAPEQITSPSEVDHRADIWGLGATLYELLSASPPFQADSLTRLESLVLHHDPVPLSDLGLLMSADLDEALDRSLAKHPEDRFDGVVDLAAWLAPSAGAFGSLYLQRIRAIVSRTFNPAASSMLVMATVPPDAPGGSGPAGAAPSGGSTPVPVASAPGSAAPVRDAGGLPSSVHR